eukprot:367232_1
MSTVNIGTGVIHHASKDSTETYKIQSSESHPDKVIKFCHGFTHLILLKENGFIQRISHEDRMFDDSFECLQQLNIIDIAFGKKHGIALTNDHEVYSFGDNKYGQLGIGRIGNIHDENNKQQTYLNDLQFIDYFAKVNQKIIEIKCGSYHSCALSKSGNIYTWGQGKLGQLGTKVVSIQILPRYVAHIPNKNEFIQHIECGPEATAAISDIGNLFTWGYGQITPFQIVLDNDNDIKIRKISIGLAHSLCLTTCGRLYGIGLTTCGQLGIDAIDAYKNKKVSRPLYLKQFKNDIIYDIGCCGLYTVICTENNGIYILGFNDCLFNKIQHIYPFKINLTHQKIQYIGFSRYDFAVITASNISTIQPSICCSNGSYIDIQGHGFNKTAFTPTVKFVIKHNNNNDNEIVEIQKGELVEIEDDFRVCVTTPNIQEMHTVYNIEYPCKMQVFVAIDSKFYSDPFDMFVIENPKTSTIFNISPNCGDINGKLKCIITDESNFISDLTNIDHLKLENIVIKLMNDESVYVLEGTLNLNNKSIEFIIPSINKGKYQVLIALDGSQFINTKNIFIGYDIKCIECKPNNIVLCEYNAENVLDIEIKVSGFVANNPDHVKLKFVTENVNDDDEKMNCFISDCLYESQSARDIVENEKKINEMYEKKISEIENNKENQLKQLIESRKEKDEEREKWLAQTEKDRKKKKKPTDIEAFEEEVKKVNDEWAEILKERENETRQINRKCRKEIALMNKEKNEIPKEEEKDNGDGYIKCTIDISKLKQWKQPNNIKIKITSNNILYSDLYSIESIDPQIKQLSPNNILISDSTQIKMYIAGFYLKNIEKQDDLKICIKDTEEKMIEVEECEINNDDNCISMTIDKQLSIGEKQIMIKLKQLFEINSMLLVYDTVKVSNIIPKDFTMNEVSKIKVDFATEINTKYIDECYLKINANDKSLILKGIISDDGKSMESEFNDAENSLTNIGAVKKAQIEISFNNENWMKVKPTISVK